MNLVMVNPLKGLVGILARTTLVTSDQMKTEPTHAPARASIQEIERADPLLRMLEFIRDQRGVVLSDWASRPQTLRECRVVFPTKLKKASIDAGTSEFTKMCINHFYPHVEASLTGNHRATVWVGGSRTVQLLESDLERRRILLPGGCKLEYPTYSKAVREATVWKFLGVSGILVQMSVG